MRGSRATRDQVREQLLAIAACRFREKGYDATSTRELASAMGLQKASLYHYMSDKADLLYEICRICLQHIHTTVEAAVIGVRSPREQLEQVIRAHVRTMLADRDMHATMLIDLRALSGERRQSIVELRDRYEALVASVIARAQDAKEIRRDISTHDLTLALLNLLNWTIFWYSPSGGLTPDQLSDQFRRVFLFGAAAVGPDGPQHN